ncbi:hypothetical protein [Chamaesiphon sp. OTE_75_metabat_556]|jgi:hypothetical protein|uniref:hypothetical protein n=1 Tax=Chamaesiphon sp. OTE_75_metabat_556 TaxID=2964692 RepID=UPI00286B92EE|nr:hypothetical protein [Chamaesiphon sp. OTE_75_metabat_556]
MNNLPDEDANLVNFLRQHRSIASPGMSDLEDRLISELDALPTQTQQRSHRSWWRYLAGGIGILVTGIIGATTFQVLNPPELSIAELDGLNLYLEAHILEATGDPTIDPGKHEDLVGLDDELL